MSAQHVINNPKKFNHSLSLPIYLGDIYVSSHILCSTYRAANAEIFPSYPMCHLQIWFLVKLYIKVKMLCQQDWEKPALEQCFVTASETLLAVGSVQSFQWICWELCSPSAPTPNSFPHGQVKRLRCPTHYSLCVFSCIRPSLFSYMHACLCVGRHLQWCMCWWGACDWPVCGTAFVCVCVCVLICVGGGFPGEAEQQSWPCSKKKDNNLFIGIAQISLYLLLGVQLLSQLF